MKITRRQLRKLIETTIKPSIPDASDEYLRKIDDLARQHGYREDADTFAGALGYPEDRSYSDDLRTYDEAGMPTIETLAVYDGSIREPNIEIVIPPELVNDVITAHQEYIAQGGWDGTDSGLGRAKHGRIFQLRQSFETAKIEYREALRKVYDHVDNEAKKSATGSHYYGHEVRGYRADEYERAMSAGGDVI